MGGTGEKIGLKREKDIISLGLEKNFFKFVPETLEHLLLYFSDDQFASLIPKIDNEIKKTLLLDQFHTVPYTFSLSLPKIMS